MAQLCQKFKFELVAGPANLAVRGENDNVSKRRSPLYYQNKIYKSLINSSLRHSVCRGRREGNACNDKDLLGDKDSVHITAINAH